MKKKISVPKVDVEEFNIVEFVPSGLLSILFIRRSIYIRTVNKPRIYSLGAAILYG